MDLHFVDRPHALERVRDALASAGRVALDCEAAGFHRYSDRLCLVQLTVGDRDFVVDPLALDVADVLRPAFEDPDCEIVMHGADFDLRLLDRDLGIRPRRIFDTQIAASLLGLDGIGLSSVLERTLGVELSKKYQRADWAQRPLPPAMLEYAALDTHHLPQLADRLEAELAEKGRLAWAREEFEGLREIRYEEPDEQDPAARVKAARDMAPREVHRLREALAWREEVARARDRAPFRVAGDKGLVEAARQDPRSPADLEALPGLGRRLVEAEGDALLERLRGVDELPDDRIRGLSARPPGRGRPEPEVEDRMRRLKAVRNSRAAELGIDRGTLLPNAILQAIAEAPPESFDALQEVPGMRNWQREVLGEDLLDALVPASASKGD